MDHLARRRQQPDPERHCRQLVDLQAEDGDTMQAGDSTLVSYGSGTVRLTPASSLLSIQIDSDDDAAFDKAQQLVDSYSPRSMSPKYWPWRDTR